MKYVLSLFDEVVIFIPYSQHPRNLFRAKNILNTVRHVLTLAKTKI